MSRAALEASIEHWERNVAAPTPGHIELGVEACPLCAVYFFDWCKGCPIAEHTGHLGCDDTPYEDVIGRKHWWADDPDNKDREAAYRAAAQAELDFLKSLLPETAA